MAMQDFLQLQPALSLKSHHQKREWMWAWNSRSDPDNPQGSGPQRALPPTNCGSPKSITKSVTKIVNYHWLSTYCIPGTC